MNRQLKLVFVFLILISCNHFKTNEIIVFESDDLKIIQLDTSFFIHESYIEYKGSIVSCNGLVAVSDDEALILDTPVDSMAARLLLDWIINKKSLVPMAVVPNHFHKDCIGSLAFFYENGVTTYASDRTFDLMKLDEREFVTQVFKDSLTLEFGSSSLINRYVGPGHTLDNLIHYFPGQAVLFGGCLVKSIGAGKGNIADADTLNWSSTVKSIIINYPDIKTVIPGHGAPGGAELLEYTYDLFKQD